MATAMAVCIIRGTMATTHTTTVIVCQRQAQALQPPQQQSRPRFRPMRHSSSRCLWRRSSPKGEDYIRCAQHYAGHTFFVCSAATRIACQHTSLHLQAQPLLSIQLLNEVAEWYQQCRHKTKKESPLERYTHEARGNNQS